MVTSVPRLTPSSWNCTPATPTLSVAAAVTDTVAATEVPPAGAVIDTAGGVVSLATVTLTVADVVRLPAASRATAISACAALVAVVVVHDVVQGAVVTSAPRLAPSSLNCTPTTATSSDALAETLTEEPETVAPLAGAVIATTGGVASVTLRRRTYSKLHL